MAAAAGSPAYLEVVTSLGAAAAAAAAADPERRRKEAKHAADGRPARAPSAYARLPVEALLYSPVAVQPAAEAPAAPDSSRLGSYLDS